jgi:hypothetical protein
VPRHAVCHCLPGGQAVSPKTRPKRSRHTAAGPSLSGRGVSSTVELSNIKGRA